MGAGKTKTVGGGAARPVADQYSQFLGQGLSTGQFGNPVNSTQGFAGAINRLLQGAPGDALSQQGLFQAMQGLGMNNNIPQVQGPGALNFQMPNMGLAAQGMDINSPFAQGIQQQLQNQQSRDIAQLRARYSGMGGMGMGTPSMQEEALYRAQAAPQIATALGQMNLAQQGANTNSFNAMANAGLGQGQLGLQHLGLGQQAQMANQGATLQNNAQNAQNAQAQGQLAIQNQSQDMQAILGVLQQLMGGFGQTQSLGTAQAGTVQQPSVLGQVLGGIQGATGLIGGVQDVMGMFGDGNNMVAPGGGNFRMPPVSQFPGGLGNPPITTPNGQLGMPNPGLLASPNMMTTYR